MTELTRWGLVCDGDRVLGADARAYDIQRSTYGSVHLIDVAGMFPPRAGRPESAATTRRLVRGSFAVAVEMLRSGGFEVEVIQ